MPLISRWRNAWHESLRFRLLALGLTPLLVAFPFVIAVLVVVGGERADSLLTSNLRSNLAGTRNYLNQLKTEAGVRVGQMVQSERLVQLLHKSPDSPEFDQVLATAAKGSGLDFLIVATPDGTILGSSTGSGANTLLPDSYVIRQARIGVANAAFERIDNEQLAAISPQLANLARVDYSPRPESGPSAETRGLLINAAAHFPLVADSSDAILVGGILLNKNFALIEHMRDIIYPVGSLPGDAEGRSAIYLDEVSITASRQRQQGQNATGLRVPDEIAETVMVRGETWIGKRQLSDQSYMAGYEAILDGDGRRIGMIGAGFPDAPYYNALWILQGMVAVLLALTMLTLSIVFLRAGRQMTQRLASISETMTQVSQGNREARVGTPLQEDELGRLSRHFDVLLDTIAKQDAIQHATLKTVADEASRRRALFEHERDGVVILNQDGSVFEANPKCAAMLGYSNEELLGLRVEDWDKRFQPSELEAILNSVGPEGKFFETVHQRKDGTTYEAEVSISRAQWSDRTFVLVLQRDISKRKAVEAELENYRLALEERVEQRTRELNVRSEQLNAIFTLSPDGFVSFDNHFAVSFVNRAFLRMSGLEESDVIGLSEQAFSEKLTKACLENAAFPGIATLRAARKKMAEEVVKPGSPPLARRRQLIELASPNGRVLEVGIRLSETENVSQILYFRDVTHETEVDRMKSEFLSTAAHELRTPMASIYGYSEILLTQNFDEEMQRDLLNTIFRQSELMSSIINELLDLARIEARRGKDFVIEKLSLADIVAETVDGFKAPTGRDLPLINAPTQAMLIKADRKKMQQALLNILSNAYKYSPNGEPVTISFHQKEIGGSMLVGVEVRDRGIGMTSAEQGRVFERFYRADSSGKIPGTGLGMSIVKEIAELHGGMVEVASQTGEGTRVTLWIPAT